MICKCAEPDKGRNESKQVGENRNRQFDYWELCSLHLIILPQRVKGDTRRIWGQSSGFTQWHRSILIQNILIFFFAHQCRTLVTLVHCLQNVFIPVCAEPMPSFAWLFQLLSRSWLDKSLPKLFARNLSFCTKDTNYRSLLDAASVPACAGKTSNGIVLSVPSSW